MDGSAYEVVCGRPGCPYEASSMTPADGYQDFRDCPLCGHDTLEI